MKLPILIIVVSFYIFIGLPGSYVYSQASSEVDYPYLGIKFTIPEGWKGQETESGYLMGSDAQPGLILMMPHTARTLEELYRQARQGLQDDNGTMLSLSGDLEPIPPASIGGLFTGKLEYNKAKAYIVGTINPFGDGVTTMAVTDPQHYSEHHKDLAIRVAKSLKFATPKESPVVKEWDETLKGAKLSYLSSSGGSDYSGYSGSSSTTEIMLCSSHEFTYYSSSFASFDVSAGFGHAGNSSNGHGTWEVSGIDSEKIHLLLHFSDGREHDYLVEYRETKTYLDGSRYFRTYDNNPCN